MAKKSEEKEELLSRLEGKINYEIEFYERSFDTKLQISTENNFIATIMVRDMLTDVIKRQQIPTLKKDEKMPQKLFNAHVDARNIVAGICEGLGSHLLNEVKKKNIKPSFLSVVAPKKIILPGK